VALFDKHSTNEQLYIYIFIHQQQVESNNRSMHRSQNIAALIEAFDARLANRPFLVSDFRGTLALRVERQSARKSKTKNDRLASLALNPLVTVPILELWAKMG